MRALMNTLEMILSREAYALWTQAFILLLTAILVLWQLREIRRQVRSAAYSTLISQGIEIERLTAKFPETEAIIYEGYPGVAGREDARVRADAIGTMMLDYFDNLLMQKRLGGLPKERREAWVKFITEELRFSILLHKLLAEDLRGTYSQDLLALARQSPPDVNKQFYNRT